MQCIPNLKKSAVKGEWPKVGALYDPDIFNDPHNL